MSRLPEYMPPKNNINNNNKKNYMDQRRYERLIPNATKAKQNSKTI